jgi:hypothetical protein
MNKDLALDNLAAKDILLKLHETQQTISDMQSAITSFISNNSIENKKTTSSLPPKDSKNSSTGYKNILWVLSNKEYVIKVAFDFDCTGYTKSFNPRLYGSDEEAMRMAILYRNGCRLLAEEEKYSTFDLKYHFEKLYGELHVGSGKTKIARVLQSKKLPSKDAKNASGYRHVYPNTYHDGITVNIVRKNISISKSFSQSSYNTKEETLVAAINYRNDCYKRYGIVSPVQKKFVR